MPQKIDKLKDILKILEDSVNKEELEKYFHSILEVILKIEKKQDEKFSIALQEFRNKLDAALIDQATGMNLIRDKIRGVRDAIPGPPGQKGEAGEPGLPGRDGMDGRDGKDADITPLQAQIDEAIKRIEATPRRVGGGFSYIAMLQHIIDDETPSGLVNGVNTDFVLANTPNPATSLKVYVNGQRMKKTEDFTLSGKTITFLTAPPTGSIILCDYKT